MTVQIASGGPPADAGAGLVWELVQAVNGLWQAYKATPAAQQRAVLEKLPRTLKAVRRLINETGHTAVTVPPTRPGEPTLAATPTPIDAALAEHPAYLDRVRRLDPDAR